MQYVNNTRGNIVRNMTQLTTLELMQKHIECGIKPIKSLISGPNNDAKADATAF